jgi:hypothetical protein
MEHAAVPRSHASSFVDAFGTLLHVDETGSVLDDTSSIFADPRSGALDSVEAVHASNALVAFDFQPGRPEGISNEFYTVVLEEFERVDERTNRIRYRVEDHRGEPMYAGASTAFDLPYDGTDRTVGVAVFEPGDSIRVLFAANLTFRVDGDDFVIPDPDLHFRAENERGEDIVDSLGVIQISMGAFVEAGYRASDIRMEWVDAAPGRLTLEVRDLDNLVAVPFGEGIVDSAGNESSDEKGSNWSFLPDVASNQPGGRYYVTDPPGPILTVTLWICGVRLRTVLMSRLPRAGDVWTLRQVAMRTEVDTTFGMPDTVFVDTQRPPVPGIRYRIDTVGGGPDRGTVDLGMIRVVPKPYLATAAFEEGPNQRKMQFIYLPPECTIRIYTISGNLVRTLSHASDEGGTEDFDLRNRWGQPIASGNYYYHVTTPSGNTHLGRFAVVQ